MPPFNATGFDWEPAPPERQVFCNRTLNLRAIPVIGYDMDYTLIHYYVDQWEGSAFEHARAYLAQRGWPVDDLAFDPDAYTLGLVFDLEMGTLLKATRFGYVVKAVHGRDELTFEELRSTYRDTVIELSSERFEFMNTLFELSRAALWCQLVELFDHGRLPSVRGYHDLYRKIDAALRESHQAGALKAEILADPDRFVVVDPHIVQTLRDQRASGKQLLLITNSDWSYTRQIMAYAFDRHCPLGTTWRDLFDIVIVSANKPRFFANVDPFFRVVDEAQSLLAPHTGRLEPGHVYFGGNARSIEDQMDSGQPLYVGDHLFGDVHVTKDVLRWRTALIARELESEVLSAAEFAPREADLVQLMDQKTALEQELSGTRLIRLRAEEVGDKDVVAGANRAIESLYRRIVGIDRQVAPLAQEAAQLGNSEWGPLMRAGNDKSLFARQVERYADVYTSRVSNLGLATPFAYLRASRGSLPHDMARATVDAG